MSELERIIEKCTASEMAFCQAACPLHVDMKGAIAFIREGKFEEALRLMRETLPFPGILGRICTRPCEEVCWRKEVEEPIAIMHLKRSAADYGAAGDWTPSVAEEKSKKIAVIGGGPAGLMAAYELRKMGYPVTLFEALPVLGGMMAVGIPPYRLDRNVLQKEISIIEKLGVEVKLNCRIGDHITIPDLRRDFAAVFIATGTQLSRRLSLAGSELEGVLWGMDFLREVNLGRKIPMKDKVVVVGGGNVAVDVALTALRLGAKEVQLACLETREEMPAFEWETQQALEEGVMVNPSCGVKRILGRDGAVEGVELVRCTSVFDAEGNLDPLFDETVTTLIPTDMVILAIGQAPDTSFLKDSGIQCAGEGFICANEVTLETGVPGIFAGGDAVYGPKSVIDAMGAGKSAAISIDRYLKGEDLTTGREGEGPRQSRLKISTEGVTRKSKISLPVLPVDQRKGNFREIELGFRREEAIEEAHRCLSCECKLCVKNCEFLKLYGENPRELAKKFEAGYFREKPKIPYLCNICSLCKSVCPEDLCIGDACLALRYQLVDEGRGPLPPHKYIDWNLDWTTSDSFILAQPDPQTRECPRVFFPGCSLSGYSPSLVLKTYDYLREKLPGTGVLLHCCGAPRRDLGERARFRKLLDGIEAGMRQVGASEIIVCCANCYKTFKHFAPQIKLRTVYEVMVELGLPEGIKTKDWTFSLYDPCTARWERGIQDSVRTLVHRLGYKIEEMKHSRELTHCCGMGGMVPYVDVWLALKKNKRQAEEAHFDLLTYCATCREMFANPEAGAKPSLHILDLIFNPDWEQARLVVPNLGITWRENQAKLKDLLLTRVRC